MERGDVIYRFDRDSWRDLLPEIADAQEQTGGALIVTASLAAHVVSGAHRWRITVTDPVSDWSQAAGPFHGFDLANGCGMVFSGHYGLATFYTTRPLLVMAGIPPWPATAVGQEIIRLCREGQIPAVPPGHPDEDCQALHCALRIDPGPGERRPTVVRTPDQVIADINGGSD